MSKKDLKTVIAEIKSNLDIVDYIESSGVSLRASGPGRYKGLCAFHSERTPSFVVSSNFQNYKCFGCGAGGDIIRFVQDYENLDFIETVKKLADEAGVEFELSGESHSKYDYKLIKQCARDAAVFFVREFRKLPEGHVAKREITGPDRDLPLDGMMYGYAPEGRQNLYKHLSQKGYSDEVILQSGVCMQFDGNPKVYDFWHGRLMFVIADAFGNPVGFSGRKLFDDDKRGKYVNSPDGPIFDKSSVLFHYTGAAKKAKEDNEIYVAEGQFDVAAIKASGSPNVVASSGTAFTKKQLLMCSRLVGENGRVVFCFDGDAAGRKAVAKVFEVAEDLQSQCYVVSLPGGVDPCDYRVKNGDSELQEQLKGAVPIIDFMLNSLIEKFDLKKPGQKAKYIEQAVEILSQVSNLSLRGDYVRRVALRSLSSVSEIEAALDSVRSSVKAKSQKSEKVNNKDSDSLDDLGYLTPSDKEKNFLQDVDSNLVKNIGARMLQLAFYNMELLPEVAANSNCSKVYRKIAKELLKSESSVVIPESFSYPLIVKTVVEKSFFPFIKVMSKEDMRELFDNLVLELNNSIESKEIYSNSLRVMEVLKDSDDIELLKMLSQSEV